MTGQELVAAARALVPAIAAGAAARDRERALPRADLEQVRAAGITAARVPARFGGPQASFPELAGIMIALGQADPNVAQSLQPHFAFQDVLLLYASPAQQARYFADLRSGAIITNALAERGGRFIGDIAARATPVAGGYRIEGTKYYCTGSLLADALWVLTGAAVDERMIAVVPVDRAGVTVEDDWDAMGQRTTASGTVRLDGVQVSEDEVMRAEALWRERNYIGAAAQLTHAAIDAGIALAAWHDALDYARTRGRPAPESGVERLADDPYVIETVGDLRVHAVQAEAVVLRAATVLEEVAERQLGGGDASEGLEHALAEASVAVAEAKVASTRAALHNAERLFQVGGASMTASELDLDRHWRNARTHTVHDPLSYKFKAIGDFYLSGRYPPIGTKI